MKDLNNLEVKTKRARGYSMEVDQKNAFAGYSDKNCVASCYWCNNAKTDEFNYDEFKEKIAEGITGVWNKRLIEVGHPEIKKI